MLERCWTVMRNVGEAVNAVRPRVSTFVPKPTELVDGVWRTVGHVAANRIKPFRRVRQVAMLVCVGTPIVSTTLPNELPLLPPEVTPIVQPYTLPYGYDSGAAPSLFGGWGTISSIPLGSEGHYLGGPNNEPPFVYTPPTDSVFPPGGPIVTIPDVDSPDVTSPPPVAVPEPFSIAIFMMGLIALLALRKRA